MTAKTLFEEFTERKCSLSPPWTTGQPGVNSEDCIWLSSKDPTWWLSEGREKLVRSVKGVKGCAYTQSTRSFSVFCSCVKIYFLNARHTFWLQVCILWSLHFIRRLNFLCYQGLAGVSNRASGNSEWAARATQLRSTEKFIYEMNIPKEKRRLEIWVFFFPTCLVQVLMC